MAQSLCPPRPQRKTAEAAELSTAREAQFGFSRGCGILTCQIAFKCPTIPHLQNKRLIR